MINQWQQSFTENPSAPVQLRFLLQTTVEYDARGSILPLAILASPHCSDAGFKTTLLVRLLGETSTPNGENRKLATLYLCVLYAIDDQVTLGQRVLDNLEEEFDSLGTAAKKLWGAAMSRSSNSDSSHRLDGEGSKMKRLKNILQDDSIRSKFSRSDLFWACCVFDKVLYPQKITLQFSAPGGRTLLKSTIEGQEEEMFLSEIEDI